MKSLNEIKEEMLDSEMNESVLGVAGGVVLGGLALITLYKGAKYASNWVGKKAVDLKDAIETAANKLEREKYFAAKNEHISKMAEKFADDDKLKSMYKELTPYDATRTVDARKLKKVKANNYKRNKEMTEIAKYIKSKLSAEEMSHFSDISAMLRNNIIEQ